MIIDGGDRACVRLLLELRSRISGLPSGTVIHLIASDPAAPIDLPAWCHLTGHSYLGLVPAATRPTYAMRAAGGPEPAAPGRTAAELWQAAGDRKAAREKAEKRRRREEQAREDAAYAKHLDQLATRTEEAWREAAALIETKRPGDYDQAVTLLRTCGRSPAGRATWPCSPDDSANFAPAISASPACWSGSTGRGCPREPTSSPRPG